MPSVSLRGAPLERFTPRARCGDAGNDNRNATQDPSPKRQDGPETTFHQLSLSTIEWLSVTVPGARIHSSQFPETGELRASQASHFSIENVGWAENGISRKSPCRYLIVTMGWHPHFVTTLIGHESQSTGYSSYRAAIPRRSPFGEWYAVSGELRRVPAMLAMPRYVGTTRLAASPSHRVRISRVQ